MPEWKTTYELVLPLTTPEEVRAKVARHPNYRNSRGLYVTMRHDVLKATVSDSAWAQNNTAPQLKASVTQDTRGTVITGTLDWSGLLLQIWLGAAIGLFLAGGALVSLSAPDSSLVKTVLRILLLAGGVGLLWSSLRQRRTEVEKREAYLAALNRELEANLRTWQ